VMFGAYVVLSFISFAAARVLRGWIEQAKFVEYDRHLGTIFGFLKGAVFSLVLTFFVVTLSSGMRKTVLESRSGRVAAIVMNRLHPVMPEELHAVLEPYIHQFDPHGLDLHDDDHDGQAGEDDIQLRSDPIANQNQDRAIQNWIAKLPNLYDPELKQLVASAFEQTAKQDHNELFQKLYNTVPAMMRNIAMDWQNGKPAAQPKTPQSNRQQLLREIGAVFAEYPEAQQAIIGEVQQSLAGLPSQVELAVLKDWHADLMGITPDPDPTSTFSTSLDARILKQLAIHKVPVNSLGQSLQMRLRGVRAF